MSKNLVKIVALLSDHQYHDGTSIGEHLSMTRAGVWKVIKKLESYDIFIKSVKGKGYILEDPLILIDKDKIKKLIQNKSVRLYTLEKTDSTNEFLKKIFRLPLKPVACISETQTQGKGRLNRCWHSPFGQNIYLSLLYPFQKDISELSGLSLVVGLAACKAIEDNCNLQKSAFIKWPNDIVSNQKKLGGSLIEIQAESHGFCNAIIGIGINVNMQKTSKTQINQHWTSIRELSGQYEDRNRLTAELINQLLLYIKRFIDNGLKDFIEEWKSRDCLFNQSVRLASNKVILNGIGTGINEQGHLILTLPNKIKQTFASGDTTLIKLNK